VVDAYFDVNFAQRATKSALSFNELTMVTTKLRKPQAKRMTHHFSFLVIVIPCVNFDSGKGQQYLCQQNQ